MAHCIIRAQGMAGFSPIILRLFFLFQNKNICCDPSLEPTRGGGFNEGSKTYVYLENKAKFSPTYHENVTQSGALVMIKAFHAKTMAT